jgi:hypothetical protein
MAKTLGYIIETKPYPDEYRSQYRVQISVQETRLGQKYLILFDNDSDTAEVIVKSLPFRQSMEAGVTTREYVANFIFAVRDFLVGKIPTSDINAYVNAIVDETLVELPKMLEAIKDEAKVIRHWPV